MIQALINNKWESINDNNLLLGTDTFSFGTGLYETFRTLEWKPIFLEQHLDRLFKSAKITNIKIHYSRSQILEMIQEVILNFEDPNQRVRILAVPENFIVYTSQLNLDPKIYEGVSALTVSANRETPDVKTTNYKVCLKAWEKANDSGCFESILLDADGVVLEGSRSNVFWIKDGKIITRENNVLPGITRQIIILRSPFPISFGLLYQSNFSDIDELFITNSGSGVIPIIKVDSAEIGTGGIGSITKELLRLYNKWLHENC